MEFDFTVDDHTYKQTIYNRYGCCFCWCKDTTVDSTEDDDRHQKSPECIFKCSPAFFCSCFFSGRLNVVFLCFQHNNNYKCNTHQDSRYDTGCKHISDGNACDGCVYNECDTRRYDDRNRARCRHQRRGERCGKSSLLYHCRNQDCAESSYSCRSGTGDCSKETCNDNTYDGDTTFFMSDAGINEVDQSFGDTGFCHDVTG